MRAHIIPRAADGMPLGRYIRRAYPMCDAAMLRRALSQRDFRLDGARIGENTPLRGGGELRCFMADRYLLGGELSVLYRDAHMAVVVKPAGLTCQRDAQGMGEDTLESRVQELFGTAWLVNRLDHFTGGVMPIALDEPTRDRLLAAFREHTVAKTYVCQTVGAPAAAHARLVHYAVKDADGSMVRVYDSPRPGALTMALSYDVTERGPVSRLRVQLETGRTHQIRAQLSHIGCPVLGDDKYGDRRANREHAATHQRLWCESIAFGEGEYAGQTFCCDAPF